jgi:hypothetical protein
MSERDARYQIVALSTSKPEDALVKDEQGQFLLFIGSINSLSRRPLNSELVDALMSRAGWRSVIDPEWLTRDELSAKAERIGKHPSHPVWRWVQNHVLETASR